MRWPGLGSAGHRASPVRCGEGVRSFHAGEQGLADDLSLSGLLRVGELFTQVAEDTDEEILLTIHIPRRTG